MLLLCLGLTCSGFPGPGVSERRVLMNPIVEYLHGYDDHVVEMFAHTNRSILRNTTVTWSTLRESTTLDKTSGNLFQKKFRTQNHNHLVSEAPQRCFKSFCIDKIDCFSKKKKKKGIIWCFNCKFTTCMFPKGKKSVSLFYIQQYAIKMK